MRNVVAVLIILTIAAAGWAILGSTLVARTAASDDAQRASLAGLWGNAQTQGPATFTAGIATIVPATKKAPAKISIVAGDLDARDTNIGVDLALDQRLKGLLWYNTYTVAFRGAYLIDLPRDSRSLHIALPFATGGSNDAGGTFEDFEIVLDGNALRTTSDGTHLVADATSVRAGTREIAIAYRSHGIGTWRYSFGEHTTDVRGFALTMKTNFANIDFPPETMSPTSETPNEDGWTLVWRYKDLIAAHGLGMAFPERLQPGPLASRISFWAPLSLGFYFFVLLMVCTLRKIDLHPINYAFLACAFFAFHLLFAYTIDRLPIGFAFAIASVVSMFLTVSYLRLVVGLRFAAVEAALAQFFYLILFSYALFNEGYSGISITIGAIVTLFVSMQWTAKLDWSSAFARRPISA